MTDYERTDPTAVDWDHDISGFDGVIAATFAEEENLTVHFTRLDCGPLKVSQKNLNQNWF